VPINKAIPAHHPKMKKNSSQARIEHQLNCRTESVSANVEQEDLSTICNALNDEFTLAAGQTIAITGAAGFLGFYLSRALAFWNEQTPADQQINVVLLDTFMRGKPGWVENISALENFTVVTSNVTDAPHKSLLDSDYIIHAASIASPIYYREHPIQTMDANVTGLRHLLDLAIAKQDTHSELRGMLFFSTSEIYGDPDPDNIPTAETYRGNVSCTGPRACYDESKRFGETLCVNFAQQHGLPVTIARPFNNYGPGLKITDGRAPPDFANNILNGHDIVLLSDGTPTRTFCYIADAVVGYYKVLFHGRAGEPYNIGNDSPEISIRDFAQLNVDIARDLFNYKGSVRFANSDDEHYLTDNPHRRSPNINKARTELGFNPIVELEQGIQNALLWYSENQHGEKN